MLMQLYTYLHLYGVNYKHMNTKFMVLEPFCHFIVQEWYTEAS